MAMELKVKDKTYKVKFGFNSFCDTDLMDRTADLINLFHNEGAEDDKDVTGMGKIKELFRCVRDLLFVGFERFNPVENKQEVGNLLDDWKEEAQEGEKRGLLDLFTLLSEELMNEGFLGDLMNQLADTGTKIPAKIPQDHKGPQR